MEENNAQRGQVSLDGSNFLSPPQVCQMLACLWWGHLVVSRLLNSALAVKVRVCDCGSDDRFHKCYESGRLQLNIVYENRAYEDPCASEIDVSPFKRAEHLFSAYSELRRHKA